MLCRSVVWLIVMQLSFEVYCSATELWLVNVTEKVCYFVWCVKESLPELCGSVEVGRKSSSISKTLASSDFDEFS